MSTWLALQSHEKKSKIHNRDRCFHKNQHDIVDTVVGLAAMDVIFPV